MLVLAGPSSEARAAEPAAKEYQIKAVFLFNVVQFVRWPEIAFTAPDAPIAIGVLGENPFGTALEDAVRGETVRGRPLIVRYARELDALRSCQAIFIARSERGRVPELLAQLATAPILTVSDVPGFAEQGGLVEFYLEGNRVRFAVNLVAARDHGLKPSSQLLSLARIVESAKGER